MFIGDNVSEVEIDFVDPVTNVHVSCNDTPDFLNDYFVNIGSN